MSESTVGFVFLHQHAVVLEDKIATLNMHHKRLQLNEKWSAFFIEDEWLQQNTTISKLKDLSTSLPFLYFVNSEDYGWSYALFAQGQLQAKLDVGYDIEFNMTQAEIEKRYPHNDPHDPELHEIWQTVQAEIVASAAYQQAIDKQFHQRNTSAFRAFELTDEEIAVLEEIVSRTGFHPDEPWDQVDRFKKALGIEEMEWKCYEYADEEIHPATPPFN